LSQSPPGLIVLGEGALRHPEQLARVRARAAIVFFRLPVTACYWALRRNSQQRDGMLMHPWLPDRLDGPRDLQPFLELLRPVAAMADHVVDMESQGVHEVVLSLQKLLPTLGAPRESTDRQRMDKG
jgi:hypothetical protein